MDLLVRACVLLLYPRQHPKEESAGCEQMSGPVERRQRLGIAFPPLRIRWPGYEELLLHGAVRVSPRRTRYRRVLSSCEIPNRELIWPAGQEQLTTSVCPF